MTRRVVQYFYRNSVVSFQEQKAFVVKTAFLLAFGLGICEGVGKDSGHGIGHVEGSPFQVQGATGKAALIRGLIRRKPTCGFDIVI